MPTLLVAVLHAMLSNAAAMLIAHYSVDPFALISVLSTFATSSAVISAIGFAATTFYLSRRVRPATGALVGVLCGLLCGGTMVLTMSSLDFSVVPYLTILAPTLLAVLLASVLERPKTGWQT